MMQYTVYFLDSGKADEQRNDEAFDAPDPGMGHAEGWHNAATTYFPNGVPTPRPTLIEPEIVNGVVSFPGFPPETAVRIRNEEGEEYVGTVAGGSVNLVDPGRYEVRLDPPFPLHPVEVEFDLA